MFDYPIPPLRGGLYTQLGVSPEATAEEINEARQVFVARLRMDLRGVQRELDAIYEKVPGLKVAFAELDRLMADTESDNSQALRAAQSRTADLERKAQEFGVDVQALRDQAVRLDKEIHDANVIAIQNPKERQEYDQGCPPFEILKLEDCGSTPLDDRMTLLWAIRAAMSDFFDQAGEEVAHPSDFTRQDFTHDFTPDSTLDRQK